MKTTSSSIPTMLTMMTMFILLLAFTPQPSLQQQTDSPPLAPLPSFLPENSHCFTHTDFVFCVGGNKTDGSTVTATASLQAENPQYKPGPVLQGVMIQGRAAVTPVGPFLVLCAGCGSDGDRYDDRMYQVDMGFVFDCSHPGYVARGFAACLSETGQVRQQFNLITTMPTKVSMASITFVPYINRFRDAKGALYIVGGKFQSNSSVSKTSFSLEVSITERHVLPRSHSVNISNTSSIDVPFWKQGTLPSYFTNMLDAGIGAFPMLERIILFYNKTDEQSNVVVSFVVGKFRKYEGDLFLYGGSFPGYLSQISVSLYTMSNVVIDGHVAYWSTWAGDIWLVDASETHIPENNGQGSISPARAVQYDQTVPILNVTANQSVASLLRTPPGIQLSDSSIVVAYIRQGQSQTQIGTQAEIAVNLYPGETVQPLPSSIVSSGDVVSITLDVVCFYSSSQKMRIATSPDCSTPISPELTDGSCSLGNTWTVKFNVSRGTRDYVVCVDRGRCPIATYGRDRLVDGNSAACESSSGTSISSCLKQSCCVNFDPNLNSKLSCLATMTPKHPDEATSGQLVREYVPAALTVISFPGSKSITRTVSPPNTTTTTSTTVTSTSTTTITTQANFTLVPGETSTTTTTTTATSTTSEPPNTTAPTEHPLETTTTTTPAPGSGSGNKKDDNGVPMTTAIYATGGGLGFCILIGVIYVVYKNNQRKKEESDSRKSSARGEGGSGGRRNKRGSDNLNSDRRNNSNNNNETPRIRPKVGSNDPMSIIPQFAVVQKIGRGGFGDVYSVRRKTDGELYALKVYRLQTFQDNSSDEDKNNDQMNQNFSSMSQSVQQQQQPTMSNQNLSDAGLGAGNNNPDSPLLGPAGPTPSGTLQPDIRPRRSSMNHRAESALSADAFNSHGARNNQIVRVGTLQKVGALAFKEQRIMRKLHRETHGRVVKPMEVYVHGSMEGQQQQQQQQQQSALKREHSSGSQQQFTQESTNSNGSPRMPELSLNRASSNNNYNDAASAFTPREKNSNNNNNNNNNKNQDDESQPLLADGNRGKNNLNSSNNNFSFNNNTAELYTADSNASGNNLLPPPDPQHPISYAGSIVAGLFELIPDGNFYMYCKSFRDRGQHLPLATIMRIFAQTADVLHIMAHRSSGVIVHGDIKPENILLRVSQGTIALADFGTSIEYRRPSAKQIALQQQQKQLAAQTGTTAVITDNRPLMGKAVSLNYAPPERIGGQAVADPALDWWSFGVLVYLTFAPKGKHTRSMAMDVARAMKVDVKEGNTTTTTGGGGTSNNITIEKSNANDDNTTTSNTDGKSRKERLFDELVAEVSAGAEEGKGFPEDLARSVMLGCLNLDPTQRLRPSMARDYLQDHLLEHFFPQHQPQPDETANNNNGDGRESSNGSSNNQPKQKRTSAGLYDYNIPFAVAPEQ